MRLVGGFDPPTAAGAGIGLVLLTVLVLLTPVIASGAYSEDLVAREVRAWEAEDFSSAPPVGLAYDANRDEFLVAAQGSTGMVLTRVDHRWERVAGAALPELDPALIVFDPAADVLRTVEADGLTEVGAADLRGRIQGADIPLDEGLSNPSAATPDSRSGETLVLDGGDVEVISPDGSVTDTIDLGVGDDALLALNPADGLLYVLEGDRLHTYRRDGVLERTYELDATAERSPEAMTFAPSTDATDDPGVHNLFLADSGTDAVIELTLEQPPVQATQVVDQAILIQSRATSGWEPPSTDPSGVTWNPNTGRLVVVDSEVNETGLWDDVNMWHITRTGAVTGRGSTDRYSDEPTGVGYDPYSNTLFISDDTGTRSVYVVRAGADGVLGTVDDQVNQIDMGEVGASDTEDPAFDPVSGHLFVLSGTDRELYRLSPIGGSFSNGANLVGSIDLAPLGPTDFEGLTLSASKGTLFVGARTDGEIFEITRQGGLVRVIEVGVEQNDFVSGLGLAPSSIDPSRASLWIADRGADEVNDGMLFEISVTGLGEPVRNHPPTVDAGADQNIILPDPAQLVGTASDDGLPSPGNLTVTWSKQSGPGTVNFGDAGSARTTATFSQPGKYVLRLTGDDGRLTAEDSVEIVVDEAVTDEEPPAEPEPPTTERPTTEPEDQFTDDDGHLFEGDINAVATAGITRGCNPPDNTRFCPDDAVTRGQMAAFLVRALNLTDDGGGDLFVDDDTSVFEGDIDRLAAAGVTRGCNPPTNDRFCPDENLTRGQMAALMVRALGYTDDGGGDLFVDDDDSVFEGDIDRLATEGVTRGCNPPDNDRFCPHENLTRGQMAAFLARALIYGG